MANDGEDGNGLRIFEKVSGCQFFFFFSLACKSMICFQKLCCSVDVLHEIAFNN